MFSFTEVFDIIDARCNHEDVYFKVKSLQCSVKRCSMDTYGERKQSSLCLTERIVVSEKLYTFLCVVIQNQVSHVFLSNFRLINARVMPRWGHVSFLKIFSNLPLIIHPNIRLRIV